MLRCLGNLKINETIPKRKKKFMIMWNPFVLPVGLNVLHKDEEVHLTETFVCRLQTVPFHISHSCVYFILIYFVPIMSMVHSYNYRVKFPSQKMSGAGGLFCECVSFATFL